MVDEVYVNHDTALTDVTVKADGQTTVVHTTQYHPFWDETKQRWVNASDLAEGDSLRSTDGTLIAVLSVDNFTDAQTMYDLTVEQTHTYYVLAGVTPVLVHNCGDDIYDTQGRMKHGRQARMTSRGASGAEPVDGQAALDNSIEITPEAPGQAPRRIGASNRQLVILDRTQQVPCACGRVEGGQNNIWHGHVREWGEFEQDEQSALIKAGLTNRKGKPRG